MRYEVGDKVVYPHHGAGMVINKEKREVLGEQREYLTIQILHSDMKVMVPVESADRAGLRKAIGKTDVSGVIEVLRREVTAMPKNWNQRLKYNRGKLKTGDVLEVAEVVRNLSLREREKQLSVGEKQMFNQAKKILASEIMYAHGLDVKEADTFLDGALKKSGAVSVGSTMDDAS